MAGKLNMYFNNMAKNNMISHAFLLCNTNYENIKNELNDIISDYFFQTKIDIENDPDIFVLKPIDEKIVKEDILKLQSYFMTKSLVNKARIYIIDEAEKMNPFAANSLLKFLEEPEENIYAFLLTNNVNKILPTIKSRCQNIIFEDCSKFILDNYDMSLIENVIKFTNDLESNKEKIISNVLDYIDKKPDKDFLRKFIKIMKYLYRDLLNYKLFNEFNYFNPFMNQLTMILTNNTEHSLISKLIILNKKENMLEYNLNLSLFVDKLIIEMGMIVCE